MLFKGMKMKNIFTIDTEDWFHANYEDDLFANGEELISTVNENVEKYLSYFKDNSVKATFFVLGYVAEKYPELVKKIAIEGHEIASHGYAHELVYNQTRDEFRKDIRKSKVLLEDIIGKQVLGYRAPSWSITKKSLWALEILSEEGYKYDSSIFPFENFLYGISGAPRSQYSSKIFNENSDLLEIPPSTINLCGDRNIPFSGGFYFRALPLFVIDKFTNIVYKEGNPVIFYLHPREIDKNQPRLKLSKRDGFIHYFGINRCESKLNYIINKFDFDTISNIYIKS